MENKQFVIMVLLLTFIAYGCSTNSLPLKNINCLEITEDGVMFNDGCKDETDNFVELLAGLNLLPIEKDSFIVIDNYFEFDPNFNISIYYRVSNRDTSKHYKILRDSSKFYTEVNGNEETLGVIRIGPIKNFHKKFLAYLFEGNYEAIYQRVKDDKFWEYYKIYNAYHIAYRFTKNEGKYQLDVIRVPIANGIYE